MSYHAGIGQGLARIGLEPMEPHFECDGCGAQHAVKPRGRAGPPSWFLNGKPPPGWRTLRKHDGSKRWDLCPACWKGPAEAAP